METFCAQLSGHHKIMFSKTLLFLIVSLALSGDAFADQPNVLLIMVDDMTRGPDKEHVPEPSYHSYSVRSKDHRYTHYASGKEELYDHTRDPHEWDNLADDPEYADLKAALKSQMEALTGDLDKTSFRAVR